jgi:mutator protein MutT
LYYTTILAVSGFFCNEFIELKHKKLIQYTHYNVDIMKNIIASLLILFTTQVSAVIYFEPTPQFKPRVEVSAVYVEYGDKILLLHRQDNKSQGNKWGIPGGKVNRGETPLQAAIREVKEETGYDISNQAIEVLPTVYIEYNETDHFVYHMFRTQLQEDPGAVKIDFSEHKGFTWVTPADGLKMDLLQDEDPCFRLVYFPEKACAN